MPPHVPKPELGNEKNILNPKSRTLNPPMCLGIPGKVTEKFGDPDLPMGKVDFGGVLKDVCLAYTPEAEVGDYVIVHVGFAISQLDEEEAMRTLELLRQIDALGVAQELGAMPGEATPTGSGAPGEASGSA
jgi:hydrogenase expression/formation protein HypC